MDNTVKKPVTMSTKNNSANFFKNALTFFNGLYYCHLCRKRFNDSQLANLHIENSTHQLLRSNFEDLNKDLNLRQKRYDKYVSHSIVMTSLTKIECLICACPISSLKCVDEHIFGATHKKGYAIYSARKNEELIKLVESKQRSNNSCSIQYFSMCFKNLIVFEDNFYYCYLCHEVLNDRSAVISHITKSKHQVRKNKKCPDNKLNLNLSLEFCQKCVCNKIVLCPPTYKCMRCNCELCGEASTLDHIKGKRHTKNCNTINPVLPKNITIQENKKEERSAKHPVEKPITMPLKNNSVNYFKNAITIFKGLYYCHLCQEAFNNSQLANLHIDNSTHQLLMSDFNGLNKELNFPQECYDKYISHSLIRMPKRKTMCLICSCLIPYRLRGLDEHISEATHKTRYSSLDNSSSIQCFLTCFKNSIVFYDNLYYCYLCDKILDDSFDAHIEDTDHQSLKHLSCVTLDANSWIYDQVPNYCEQWCKETIVMISQKELRCLACEIDFREIKSVNRHVNTNSHGGNIKNLFTYDHPVGVKYLETNREIEKKQELKEGYNKKLRTNKEQKTNKLDEIQSTDLEFAILFENSIIFYNGLYFCYLCGINFDDTKFAIIHTTDSNHQLLYNRKDKVESECFSQFYQNYVLNSIVSISGHIFECLVCDCTIMGLNCVNEHVIGKKHAKTAGTALNKKTPIEQPRNNLSICFDNFIAIQDNSYFCNSCEKGLGNLRDLINHIQETKHHSMKKQFNDQDFNVNLPDDLHEVCVFEGIFPIVKKNSTRYRCFTCDTHLSSHKDIKPHVLGNPHKKKLYAKKYPKENVIKITSESVKNSPKNTVDLAKQSKNFAVDVSAKISGNDKLNKKQDLLNSEYEETINTLSHCTLENKDTRSGFFSSNITESKSEKCPLEKDTLIEKPRSGLDVCFDNFITMQDNFYFCNLCEKGFGNLQDLIDHTQDSKHHLLKNQFKDQDFIVNLPDNLHELCVFQSIFPINRDKCKCYRCFICKTFIEGDKNIKPHILGKAHKKKFIAINYSEVNLIKMASDSIKNLPKKTVVSLKSSRNFTDDVSIKVSGNNVCDQKEDLLNLGCQAKINTLTRDTVKDTSSSTISLNRTKSELQKSSFKQNTAIGGLESVISICFDNFIIIKDNFHFCNLCEKGFDKFENLLDHIQESKHYLLKKQFNDQDFKVSLPDDFYDVCVFQGIFPIIKEKRTRYRCFICDTYLNSHNDIISHVFRTTHVERISEKDYRKEYLFTKVSESEVPNKENASSNASSLNKIEPNLERSNSCRSSKEYNKNTGKQLKKNKNRWRTVTGMFVFCNICNEKFMSFVQLHEHASIHFRQYFGPDDPIDKSNDVDAPPADWFANDSGEESRDIKVTGYLNQPKPLQSTSVPKRQHNKTTSKSVPLEKSNKFKSAKIQFSDLDVETDKPKNYDIYKIDEQQLKMITFSINRSIEEDKDKVYCVICRESIKNLPIKMLEHFRDIEHDKNLWQMILDDFEFQSFPKVSLFSDLQLARESMEDISDERIHCYACEKDVKNDISSLKKHLSIQEHFVKRQQKTLNHDELLSKLKRNWYDVQGYWCVFCNMRFSQENHFVAHLMNKKHKKVCAKFSEHEDLIFDYCPSCVTLIYGTSNSFAYHSQSKYHKYYRDKPFFTVNNLSPTASQMLNDPDTIAEKIVESLDLNAEQRKKEVEIMKDDIETIIRPFIEAKAWPFGSRISGLGSDTSDLDIFLDCNNRYYHGLTSDNILQDLRRVENALKLCKGIWTINRTITTCRVPIIKVNHVPTGVECNISFANGLTYETTRLLKTIFQKLPLCRKLILFIKQWMINENLCSDEGIRSYAIAWMVIYYLQTKFILPTIITLIEQHGESKIIGGWEAGINLDFHIPTIDYNFKMILKGFFNMYAEFDYRNNVICPLLGEPIKKEKFIDPLKRLPIDMEPYKCHIRHQHRELLAVDSPMVLQDPLELSNNMTKAVDKVVLNKFRKLCLLSTQKLADDYKIHI